MRMIHGLFGVAGALAAGIVLAPPSTAAASEVRTTSQPSPDIGSPPGSADKAAIVKVLLAHDATPAEAAAIAEEDLAARATADVPSCVSAKYSNPRGPYQNVKVTNGCAVKQRVKVVWAYATDSACHSLAPGATWTDHHFNQFGPDRWDGLKAC